VARPRREVQLTIRVSRHHAERLRRQARLQAMELGQFCLALLAAWEENGRPELNGNGTGGWRQPQRYRVVLPEWWLERTAQIRKLPKEQQYHLLWKISQGSG